MIKEGTCKSTQKFKIEHKIKLLQWSSQSPDINLWSELKRSVHKIAPRTPDDLEGFCKKKCSDYFLCIQQTYQMSQDVIKCRAANNAGCTLGFIKKRLFLNEGFNFIRINLFQLQVRFFSLFQCEVKLVYRSVEFVFLYHGCQQQWRALYMYTLGSRIIGTLDKYVEQYCELKNKTVIIGLIYFPTCLKQCALLMIQWNQPKS